MDNKDEKRVKFLYFSAGILIALLILIFALYFYKPSPEYSKFTVAITFDVEYPYAVEYAPATPILDGSENFPGEEKWLETINKIVKISEQEDVKFQFNVLGKTAEAYPEVIKKLSLAGDISCHTFSHKKQTSFGFQEKVSELKQCKDVVERIIKTRVQGNRFPYTNYDDESHAALESAEYKWDSSVWKDERPYKIESITEFPIDTTDDWNYFINKRSERKLGDEKEFFSTLLQDIKSKRKENNEKNGKVYVVVLHPWVLAGYDSEEKVDAFEDFIKKLKRENIKIMTLDDYYKENFLNKLTR